MRRRWNESCTNLFLWIKILDCWSSSLPGNFIKYVQLMQIEGFFRDFVTGQRKKNVILRSCYGLTAWASMLFCLVLSRWSKRLLNCCESGRLLNCSWKPRGGGLPWKRTGVVIGNFEESVRGIKILFCGRGLKFFTLKRHELWKFYFEVNFRTLFIVFRTILVQSFRVFYWNITWVNVRL